MAAAAPAQTHVDVAVMFCGTCNRRRKLNAGSTTHQRTGGEEAVCVCLPSSNTIRDECITCLQAAPRASLVRCNLCKRGSHVLQGCSQLVSESAACIYNGAMDASNDENLRVMIDHAALVATVADSSDGVLGQELKDWHSSILCTACCHTLCTVVRAHMGEGLLKFISDPTSPVYTPGSTGYKAFLKPPPPLSRELCVLQVENNGLCIAKSVLESASTWPESPIDPATFSAMTVGSMIGQVKTLIDTTVRHADTWRGLHWSMVQNGLVEHDQINPNQC